MTIKIMFFKKKKIIIINNWLKQSSDYYWSNTLFLMIINYCSKLRAKKTKGRFLKKH